MAQCNVISEKRIFGALKNKRENVFNSKGIH
jgi:hypothetical protein